MISVVFSTVRYKIFANISHLMTIKHYKVQQEHEIISLALILYLCIRNFYAHSLKEAITIPTVPLLTMIR